MDDVVCLGSQERPSTGGDGDKQLEETILKNLSASLGSQARSATFACGGSVAFKSTEEITMETCKINSSAKTICVLLTESDLLPMESDSWPSVSDDTSERSLQLEVTAAKAFTDDVQVRFGETGEGVTLNFGSGGADPQELDQLLGACQPAPFGRGGETVFDEQYRKAGKLDRSEFATNFCPYETGIIDVVTQLLVPQYKHDEHSRSIKAELYKLNVYSAPGGKFKPHVDTPRSREQIGSLVVSLPSIHQGGQLVVGSQDLNAIFDWSTTNKTQPHQIKWAAFYSDCQHEVHEVISGHRVTLTYNLFLTRGVGHLAGASPALDCTQLTLYKGLEGALKNHQFFHRGRVLAAYLTHSYAHTHDDMNFLPHSLKGADMALWSIVKALGLNCYVVPTMSVEDDYFGISATLFRWDFNEFEAGGEYEEEGRLEQEWGDIIPDHKVTWLSQRSRVSEKAQMAYMAYGNQAELSVHYPRAVMLIRIPSFHERSGSKTPPKSFWAGIDVGPGAYDPYADDSDLEYHHPLETEGIEPKPWDGSASERAERMEGMY